MRRLRPLLLATPLGPLTWSYGQSPALGLERMGLVGPGRPLPGKASRAAWLGNRSTPVAMLSGVVVLRCRPGWSPRQLPPNEWEFTP
jgi:hypothetical protein